MTPGNPPIHHLGTPRLRVTPAVSLPKALPYISSLPFYTTAERTDSFTGRAIGVVASTTVEISGFRIRVHVHGGEVRVGRSSASMARPRTIEQWSAVRPIRPGLIGTFIGPFDSSVRRLSSSWFSLVRLGASSAWTASGRA